MVPMWPQTEEEDEVLVQVVEVITSIEDDEDEERVITDLDSHGSSADDFSDYGSGKFLLSPCILKYFHIHVSIQ